MDWNHFQGVHHRAAVSDGSGHISSECLVSFSDPGNLIFPPGIDKGSLQIREEPSRSLICLAGNHSTKPNSYSAVHATTQYRVDWNNSAGRINKTCQITILKEKQNLRRAEKLPRDTSNLNQKRLPQKRLNKKYLLWTLIFFRILMPLVMVICLLEEEEEEEEEEGPESHYYANAMRRLQATSQPSIWALMCCHRDCSLVHWDKQMCVAKIKSNQWPGFCVLLKRLRYFFVLFSCSNKN